jgi:UDP-glucose 4-epimerase
MLEIKIKLKKLKTITIGSNGYIGRNLSYLLNQHGALNFDFDLSPKTENSWMKYSSLDVTNKDDFNKIDLDVDVIYFMAGITGTSDGFDSYENYYNVNVVGLTNLLNFVKENDIKPKIIFPSTRLVYKGIKDKPLSEDAKKDPKTIYALTKITCENTLKIYNEIYNINYEILRICVPYGNLVDEEYSYGTIGFFMDKAKNNEPITLYGNGELKRTFTHLYDICNSLINIAMKTNLTNDIYNIGGETFSLLEIAKQIQKKYDCKIEFIDWPEIALKIESGDTIFDSKKLDKYLNIKKYKKLNI